MDPFIELSTQLTLLSQQLEMRQQAYGQHQRVASPLMWHPNMPLSEV